MSFGSDSPGGSVEGIGGNESGIGGNGGDGGGGMSGGGGYSNVAEGGSQTAGSFGGLAGTESYAVPSVNAFSYGLPGVPSVSGLMGSLGLGAPAPSYSDMGTFEGTGAFPVGGYPAQSDINAALRAMPAEEQEKLFREVIEPTLSTYQGWQGQAASKIAEFVFNNLLNAAVPGLGTLSKITGATGYMSDKMMDMATSQAIAEKLGIREANTIGGMTQSDGAEVMQGAINAGKTPQDILNAFNEVIREQGGDMSTWDEIWGGITGSTAAGAATGAAGTSAAYQQQALDYLKSREAMPLQISGGAMEQLGGLYNLPGGKADVEGGIARSPGIPTQQERIDLAMQSPMYGAMMGGRQAGEEAIMRQAGMTGGLRSGNVQENLYDYNTQLQNTALMSAYGGQIQEEDRQLNEYYNQLGGLQTLAGMQPGGAANIAQTMGNIGSTLAGGQTAAAQAQQSGVSNLIGLGGAAYQAVGGYEGIKDIGTDIYTTVASWF